MRCYNPFSFTPLGVTLISTVVYLAVIIPLLVVHETVPDAPTNGTSYRGLNITEAWLDLDQLSTGYHPFNSRKNDEVRDWLLQRIGEILDDNGVKYQSANGHARPNSKPTTAVVFNDLTSNYTSTALTSIGVSGRKLGTSTYFEGNNIIVYIRGSEDDAEDWWKTDVPITNREHGKGAVMVNAHFDSVSTGYGATDDGVGVTTALQLIKYFTTEGNTPKTGVVALFNNNEEDGLYGAKAFLSHPMASFIHTFLNLEGAGAGGRATLFRSTDTEVTRAYAKARHPFGSVISADAFASGFVRSETDYVVFRAEGYRGLDVAFWEPRSKYHTDQDDAKHTSKASVWHMLSASVETMKYLTSNTKPFVGERGDKAPHKVKNGHGSDGVWFDLFGQFLAVLGLRTLFAWSLTLLIVSPLILMLVTVVLIKSGKYYLFAGSVNAEDAEIEPVSLHGWRGLFRFPTVAAVSSAVTIGGAYLLRKVNPLIIYSSPYSVWAMSLSVFFCFFWFLMAGCNFVRPSALHRLYALIWMFSLGWLLLVATTVFEDRFNISSGYIFVFYESALFLATLIGLLELFALPRISSFIKAAQDENEAREGISALPHAGTLDDDHNNNAEAEDGAEPEASETTPLVGSSSKHTSIGTTFAKGYRNSVGTLMGGAGDERSGKSYPFGDEQAWSAMLPRWTWFLQFLIIGPFTVIVVGQVGLLLVTATAQTGTDGSALLLPYLLVAFFTILVLLPVTPFIHRITHHIPTFVFLVLIGTLIYNLIAFPFSPNNRYKAYFQQTVDLDSGINHVTLAGLEEYIREIIPYVPSASGQEIICEQRPATRSGIDFCSWKGLPPKVVDNVIDGIPPEKGYKNWLNFTVTRVSGNKATFKISGAETRGCALRFDDPFTAFRVHGAAKHDGRWADVPESGSDQIKLWHRDWNREWVVDVEWQGKVNEGRSGKVVCLWSDHNVLGTIPALDEVQKFAPEWTSVVKLTDGLVEGHKAFMV